MVTFTFIRHGQSTDNVKKVWAGWKDAPLSNHGMKQATSLGKWFSDNDVHFTAILSSNLDRAATTAETILNHQSEPHPPHVKSLLLREQYFGIAEGKPWSKRLNNGLSLEEHYEQGIFPHLPRRSDRFPGGESRDDLAARAERAIDELLMPHILSTEEQEYVHIAVISHGLFIREIVNALYRREFGKERLLENYRGLSNTGWTRVIVEVKNPQHSLKSISPLKLDLSVRITDFDKHEHLNKLVRQRGGIGSLAHDPKQKDIRGFFAGATSKS
ncbi:phosphoglycerate mutase-like protein [Lentinula guzmanii]|uniref:Phosphoglycerate mutase-like protein n=2 Tax=Lentinula TaxID=5352 RepID=A0AA38JJP2_9AGAR|nr:phosphoglycerate mutase-like protein [Lentinula guzmanii]KAJ3791262.1 phosphoglycerate mutase-like protein [Lentinula aff. detonsa]KAJ3801574.1 phosphoglycerate mutase-like protein [Lentinula aff. detonsa]